MQALLRLLLLLWVLIFLAALQLVGSKGGWGICPAISWCEWRQLKFWVTLLEYDGMHSVNRAIIVAAWEEFLALDCARYDVAYQWVLLGQVCCEIHLLPLESLPNAQPRKSEIWAYCRPFDKVEQTILWIDVYALWMLLLIIFTGTKNWTISVLILENMGILLSFQPIIL